jgi:glycine dehydrogenase subunit 1
MLARIGFERVEELFAALPAGLRLGRGLKVPEGRSEQEVLAHLTALAAQNENAQTGGWFLGAGSYSHFLPSAVDALVSRAEFTTSYTPYQAEISQGTLQAIFEWQTMLCSLTGLDVANASMYDGASATAEAALMAIRVTRRKKVAVSAGLHPSYRQVLSTYLGGLGAELVTVPRGGDGRSDTAGAPLDEETACWIVQHPSFLGCVEDLAAAEAAAHAAGALFVVSLN